MVFFDVLKICQESLRGKKAIGYFAKDEFNLANPIWKRVFWDSETETIVTDKSRQRFATLFFVAVFSTALLFAQDKPDRNLRERRVLYNSSFQQRRVSRRETY